MALTDMYELVDEQTMFGQKILNVYFYEQTAAVTPTTGLPNVAAELGFQWLTQILDSVRAVQTGDLVHTAIHVRNLFDDSDRFDSLISLEGLFAAATADTDSAFVALGFKETLDAGGIRPGSKRYAGIRDTASTDGVVTDSSLLSNATALGLALANAVQSGAVTLIDSFLPVVIKRIAETVAGETTYRLPENLTETVFGIVIDALFSTILTSQVSRKVGHGS